MTRLQRIAFLVIVLASAASAAGFVVLRYMVEPADEFSAYGHPAAPWLLDAHVLLATALTLVLGVLLGVHVLPSLSGERRARKTGILLLASAAILVASGPLLGCLSGELARVVCGWVHGLSGVVFTLGIPVHLAEVRRARRQECARFEALQRGPRARRERPRRFVGAR